MKKKRKSWIRSYYASLPPAAKTGIALGAIGIGGLIIYKVVNNQLSKWKMRKDIKTFKTMTIKEANINLAEISKQIYDALGVGYPKYDPRSWNENEEEATLAVLKVPKTFIPQLENKYQSDYKRNLRNDLETYLDEYWNEVRHLFI